MTEEKLLLIKEKLDALGLDTRLSHDGTKLDLLDSKDKILEILEICNELNVKFIQEQTPMYGPADPITFERPIVSFITSEWFEAND